MLKQFTPPQLSPRNSLAVLTLGTQTSAQYI